MKIESCMAKEDTWAPGVPSGETGLFPAGAGRGASHGASVEAKTSCEASGKCAPGPWEGLRKRVPTEVLAHRRDLT